MIKANFMTFDPDQDRYLSLTNDMLVQMHVPAKIQKYDLDLFQTKWFDYRRMTPLQATVEYIKAYEEVYRMIYARELDIERAKYVKVYDPIGLFTDLRYGKTKAKARLTGYWKGRQIADALGIPYAIYIENVMTYRLRRWQRTHLPSPSLLYHEYDVEKMQIRWEEMQAGRLYLPEDPAFLVQNYQNLPYQNDFHEWLFKQANMRTDRAWNMAEMIQRDFLPIDKVAERVEPDVYQQVERYLSTT